MDANAREFEVKPSTVGKERFRFLVRLGFIGFQIEGLFAWRRISKIGLWHEGKSRFWLSFLRIANFWIRFRRCAFNSVKALHFRQHSLHARPGNTE